jgi:hypothetical protein
VLKASEVSQEVYDAEQALANRLNTQGLGVNDVDTDTAEHPEGRKRGGVVAVYSEGDAYVFFDELEEQWVGYNNLE